jgi:RHS repeat-associated protein
MLVVRVSVAIVLVVVIGSTAHAAPTIQITSPSDQANANPTGGAGDPVDVTYQVTGNTCVGVKSTYSIVPFVNGVAASCSGSGCSCDGTSESCNNVTKTITIDGSAFRSCLNTIQLRMSPPPFCSPLCFTPCSPAPESNVIQVWQSNEGTCTPPKGCNRGTIGKPVDVASGDMYHEMTDLRVQGPLPIEFTRRYDSRSTYDGPMGFGWQHSFSVRLEPGGTGQEVLVDREARRIYFAKVASGAWDENRGEHLILTQPGSPAWRITDKGQMKWEFDSGGRLTKITDRNNNVLLLGYTGTNLTSIGQDINGDATADRAVTLTYYGTVPDRIHTITAGGRTVTYTYNAGGNGNLERVDYSDGNFATYEYTDSGGIHRLTAAKDAFTHVIEAHGYDGGGRVNATNSDSGNYAYTLTYDSATQTTVTNSLGVGTVYSIDAFKGIVAQRTGPGCASCGDGGATTTFLYDAFRNPTSITDGRGVITEMTYDGKGNVMTRKEAKGTARERTWTFTYNPTFNFPATITIPSVGTCSNPNRVVTNTYNGANGDLLTEQVVGCNDTTAFSFTTTYTYDGHGQVKTIDGPRTDVTDLTTYDYFTDGDADVNKRGRLQRLTNALSQQTNCSQYDLFGNVGSVTDPNNVETTYLYDFMDRLTEKRIKGAAPADDIVTENHYDSVGNLDFIRLPNCVETGVGCAFSLDYTYDSVNRLKEIVDPVGNKIVYTYDTEGNRTREEYRDPAATVKRFTSFKYDTFNRLQYTYFNATIPEAGGSVFYKYGYYADGTRQTEQDPLGHVTTFDYDELKRLTTVTQTVNAIAQSTTYDYDRLDGLKLVTDPNALQTTYTNGDLGWRLRTLSPDTGTTSYSYDPAGNLLTTQNANGITTTRAYDALNRPTTVTYPDTTLNLTYTYDSNPVTFGIGRRTGMSDPSGTSTFGFDRRGLLTSEQKATGGATYTTGYDHDKTGNLTEARFPTSDASARQGKADYTYDAADRVSLVTTQIGGTTTTVANAFQYQPFGPRSQLTFGNTLVDARSFDTRYQLGNWTLGGLLSYIHVFNNDGNLTSRTDNLNAANNRTFGYDEIHRLTGAAGPWGLGTACPAAATYSYDKNGNRQCKGETSPASTYAYTASTNKLASSSGGEVAAYGYDNNGNTTGDGTHTYQYSQADRLATVDSGATATYTYDGDNRRSIKTASGTTTYFFFDPGGRLLQEFVPASGAGKDYLYLHDAPIARVDWSVTEQNLGSVLAVNKPSPNVHLDWSPFPSASNTYVLRRKQVVDPNDKTFNGAVAIATLTDPTKTFDDPVLGDANRYDYRVFKRTKAEALFYYHTDHLGTPIAMTDGSAAFVWRAEFRPFGDVHSLPVSAIANNVRFPGQYGDGESGSAQNFFRDYSSRNGSYLEPDPLGLSEAGGAAGPGLVYGYSRNAPTMSTDRRGLIPTRGCAPQRAAALENAAQKAEAASRTCVGCAGRDRPRLTQLFRNTTYHCVDIFEQGIARIPSGRCAQGSDDRGNYTGRDITFLDPAFEDVDPKYACGCLQATVLHEVLHLFDRSLSEDAVREGARKCFSCAQQF